jgi:predicted RNA-binding protein
MCESDAYLILNGQEFLIMESVDVIEPVGNNEWHLVSMFGESKRVKAELKLMQLVDHRILFEAQTGLASTRFNKPLSMIIKQ